MDYPDYVAHRVNIRTPDVTMIQRSSTLMFRIEDLATFLSRQYLFFDALACVLIAPIALYQEHGPPLEFADKLNCAMPFIMHSFMGPRKAEYLIKVDRFVIELFHVHAPLH